MAPSEQFVHSVAANISYWLDRIQNLEAEELTILEQERHNLYRATEFGARLPATQPDTAELILECEPLVDTRGYWLEWIPLLEKILSQDQVSDLQVKAKLLHQLGFFLSRTRQFERAVQTHQQELEVAKAAHDDFLIARAHGNFAITYIYTRQYDLAEKNAQIGLSLFEKEQDMPDRAGSMMNILGLIAQARGEWEVSKKWFHASMEKYRSANKISDLAKVIGNLAVVEQSAGDFDSALTHHREASALLEQTADELTKISNEYSMGTLFYRQGKLREAEAAYLRANTPYLKRAAPIYTQAMVANNLGGVYLALGEPEKAEAWLLEAVNLWHMAGAKLALANTLATLIRTLIALDRTAEIRLLFEEALAIVDSYPEETFSIDIRNELDLAREYLPH